LRIWRFKVGETVREKHPMCRQQKGSLNSMLNVLKLSCVLKFVIRINGDSLVMRYTENSKYQEQRITEEDDGRILFKIFRQEREEKIYRREINSNNNERKM
jgi:hypothetical protein